MKLNPNDVCWCGSGRKYKKCHMAIDEQTAIYRDRGCLVPDHRLLKTPEQMEGLRASAKVNVAVLDAVAAEIHAGMSKEEIDRLVHRGEEEKGCLHAPPG